MVDREARDRTAEFLRHVAAGRVTEKDLLRFDKSMRTEDRAVSDALFVALDMPVDWHSKKVVVDDADRKTFCKTILFLQTDNDYEYPVLDIVSAVVGCMSFLLFWAVAIAFAIGVLMLMVEATGFVGYLSGRSMIDSPWLCALAAVVSVGSIAYAAWVIANKAESWVHRAASEEDDGPWPFSNNEEYREALKHPKLLCGKRAA